MTCEEADQFLMDYIFGDLPRPLRLRFEQHVATCAACRTYLRTYQMAVRLGQAAFDEPAADCNQHLPPELVSAILAAVAS